MANWFFPDQLPYIWDYWSIIGRCKPYQLIKQWRKPLLRHSSLEWCRWDSSSSSYVCFLASIRQFLADFPLINFRTFETTDPSLDDAQLMKSKHNGVNPCQGIQAWNGVNGTPLAVIMSVSMLPWGNFLAVFPDQLPYIWDYWSIIGRCKPYQLIRWCHDATPRHSSLEWCRWDSSSCSYVRFMLLYTTQILANWFFPDQLPYIWDYWSIIIGRCKHTNS